MTLLNTNYACFHFDEWRNGEIAEMEKIGGMEKFDECFHFKNRGIPSIRIPLNRACRNYSPDASYVLTIMINESKSVAVIT